MNIKKAGEEYKVESGSTKGKWYSVDPKKPWCECPAYKFRHMKSKTACKHITAVREYIERTQQKTIEETKDQSAEVLSFIEEHNGEIDSMTLVEKYGDELIDSLIGQGELIERGGKIKILK